MLREMGRSAAGRRKVRYAAASMFSTALGQAVLITSFGVLRWSGRDAALFSFVVAAVSSYHLNRLWVWGRRGRSELFREVVPFWTIAAVGLVLSTTGIVVAEQRAASLTDRRSIHTVAVMVASLSSLVAVWIIKYLILGRYVFARSPRRDFRRDG